MYLIGIVAATVVARVLKKTLLRGPTPPFVMELPSYKLPDPSIVLHRVLEPRLVVRAAGRHADRGRGGSGVGQLVLPA